MKKVLFLLALLICHQFQTKANKIDSLSTGKDVQKFIAVLFEQKFDAHYYTFSVTKPDSADTFFYCDSSVIHESDQWQKTDFNKDGLTDLFVIIYEFNTKGSGHSQYAVYAVIDQTNDKYELIAFPPNSFIHCYSLKLFEYNSYPCLLYHYYKSDYVIDTLPGIDTSFGFSRPKTDTRIVQIAKTDTLIYKFGGFVELNTTGTHGKPIESIYFETSDCFITCPVFSLNISKTGDAHYIRQENFEEKYGDFRTRINANEFDEITGLIGYIYKPNLQNEYEAHATDQPTSKLKIYFSDGDKIEITDYGLRGTSGLIHLYHLLFKLRYNQKWE